MGMIELEGKGQLKNVYPCCILSGRGTLGYLCKLLIDMQ